MPRLHKLALSFAMALLVSPGIVSAQDTGTPGSENVWTLSTDASNNLMIQDLATLVASQGTVTGEAVCMQWAPQCTFDLPRVRNRYTLRNLRDKKSEWRIEVSDPRFAAGTMTLPLEVGVVEPGVVQVVSGIGAWNVELRRIPVVNLRAGEGKKWNVDLVLTDPAVTNDGCWIEVRCPGSN